MTHDGLIEIERVKNKQMAQIGNQGSFRVSRIRFLSNFHEIMKQ